MLKEILEKLVNTIIFGDVDQIAQAETEIKKHYIAKEEVRREIENINWEGKRMRIKEELLAIPSLEEVEE